MKEYDKFTCKWYIFKLVPLVKNHGIFSPYDFGHENVVREIWRILYHDKKDMYRLDYTKT